MGEGNRGGGNGGRGDAGWARAGLVRRSRELVACWAALLVFMPALAMPPDPNEPNDTFAEATPMSCPAFASNGAEIKPSSDLDYYLLSGTAGAPVFMDIDAAINASNLDSFLEAFDSSFVSLGSSDDNPAPGEVASSDSYLEAFMPGDGQLYVKVSSFVDPNTPATMGAYDLLVDCLPPPGPLSPGDLLGSTARAGATLIDINPTTGAGSFRGRLGDADLDNDGVLDPVTEIEFRDDGALIGSLGEGMGMLIDIEPAMAGETLRCTHSTGSINGLEFVGGTLYGVHRANSFTPSDLVIVADPDVSSVCALTVIGSTGLGNIGGLAWDSGSSTLYGCTSGATGGGDLVTCSLTTGVCTAVGATGFDDCAALEFDAGGTLLGGIGGRSVHAGKLITINKTTGLGTDVGPTGFPRVSGLTFVPDCPGPPTLCNSAGSFCTVAPGVSPQVVDFIIENPGAGFLTSVLGVDIQHNGNDLRTAPGATPAAQLLARLSFLATLPEDTVSGQLVHTDTIFVPGQDEVVGYLAASESLCNGSHGGLGQGRGIVDAAMLPPATP